MSIALSISQMADYTKPNKIREGLWLGGIFGIAHVDSFGCTHILSTISDLNVGEELELTGRSYVTKHLEVIDMESADLLSHLPDLCDFIEQGRAAGGAVYVHCAAGVSRSATTVIAYLMRSEQLSFDAALEDVRRYRPQAFPNMGFQQQLRLWEAMGCRLDPDNAAFRRYSLAVQGRRWAENGGVDQAALPMPTDADIDQFTRYRCRKCRRLLATERNVVEVEAGPGPGAFPWRKRDRGPARSGEGAAGGQAPQEPGLWIQPLQWMDGIVGAVQGKLHCPGCGSRLGSFNWSGMQSASGRWVVPAFQLHMSRVDTQTPLPPALAALVRHPTTASTPPSRAAQPPAEPVTNQPMDTEPVPLPTQPSAAGTARTAGTGTATSGMPALPADVLRTSPNGQLGLQGPPIAPLQRMHISSLAEAQTGQPTQGAAAMAVDPAAPANGHMTVASLEGAAAAARPNPGGPPFTHLVFDCDGVLVDSERASCEGFRQAILQVTGFDVPHRFPDDYVPVFGMDTPTTVEYYNDRFKLNWDVAEVTAAVTPVKERLFRELTADGISAFSGVVELVQWAQTAGLGVGVASSGAPEKIRHNLQSSGLWALFKPEFVVSAKEVAKGKPAPDVYIECLRRLGCRDNSRAMVIEDAVHGLRAAKAAGAYAVGITNSLPRDLLAAEADLVIDSLTGFSPEAVPRAAL